MREREMRKITAFIPLLLPIHAPQVPSGSCTNSPHTTVGTQAPVLPGAVTGT